MSRPLIYLADLTHTGQVVASNVAPLGIGVIASYLKQHLSDVDVELFKYPSDLDSALGKQAPDVIGFANYSWNCELAYEFASRIKDVLPRTVVVFGGPNYGLTEEEIRDFWRRYPRIDFYVVKEGEIAFLKLFEELRACSFDADKVRASVIPPSNCHYLKNGDLVMGGLLPRVKDLGELGSPYLMGLMDKFFDDVLIPMIHTTRGCPFACTFCTEGNSYYTKVAHRYDLKDELLYIAQRKKSVQDLVITDANFGMFREDAEKANTLAAIQTEYGWPKRILVSTGKNQKERIIEVASKLNGAISIAASLQSTNAEVLVNIKRSNISGDGLRVIVEKSTAADTPTYTEIILGLPGDSVKIHTQSLRDVIDAGLGIVRMYQLILLPQTELNTPETRAKYAMKTKFRINPRSFGKYGVLGKDVCAIEAEEICISNSTMTSEDYFLCRELDLTVEIIHNTGMFIELQGLCLNLGISWFDLIVAFFEKRRSHGPKITALYDSFTANSQKRLWDSAESVQAHVASNIDAYLNDPYGTNEMAMSKAIAFFQLQDELHDILFAQMSEALESRGLLDEHHALYIAELEQYSKLRKKDFIDASKEHSALLHFDFANIRKLGFRVSPRDHYDPCGFELRFFHDDEQKKMIDAYIVQYGLSVDGLGRILMRAPLKALFRDIDTRRSKTGGLSSETFG